MIVYMGIIDSSFGLSSVTFSLSKKGIFLTLAKELLLPKPNSILPNLSLHSEPWTLKHSLEAYPGSWCEGDGLFTPRSPQTLAQFIDVVIVLRGVTKKQLKY